MTVREKMVAFRKENDYTLEDMSYICDVSATLLRILEEGGVTGTQLVEKVRKGYHLTEEEAELLLPINLQPHGGDYDPLRYMDLKDIRALTGERGGTTRYRSPGELREALEKERVYSDYMYDKMYRTRRPTRT